MLTYPLTTIWAINNNLDEVQALNGVKVSFGFRRILWQHATFHTDCFIRKNVEIFKKKKNSKDVKENKEIAWNVQWNVHVHFYFFKHGIILIN